MDMRDFFERGRNEKTTTVRTFRGVDSEVGEASRAQPAQVHKCFGPGDFDGTILVRVDLCTPKSGVWKPMSFQKGPAPPGPRTPTAYDDSFDPQHAVVCGFCPAPVGTVLGAPAMCARHGVGWSVRSRDRSRNLQRCGSCGDVGRDPN